ncbi:hypothetical protein IJI91_01075 [Candidatus Saccharibacteria bacterium]|nr:hypothetical protein [Candidatus Saccharibacteria bacterium]
MSKLKLFSIFALGVLFCSLLTATPQPTYAVSTTTIPSSKITKVKSFKIHNRTSQGATLTKEYYVWSDWPSNSGVTSIYKCKRSGCKTPTKIASGHFEHAAALYNKWGSDNIQILNADPQRMWCAKLSDNNKSIGSTSKKCGGVSAVYSYKWLGDSHGHSRGSTMQGWTKYSDYYLRGYGDNGSIKPNEIQLFKNKKGVKYFKIPKYSGEIEDVMVDGDTGQVWFTISTDGSGKVHFYRVDKSVFKNYFGSTSSSGSDNNDGGNRGKNPYINREPSNPISDIATRTSANQGIVDTTFFGSLQDDGEGCGIWMILNIILTVLTSGVIIAATIGMLLSAITYMTAKDSPEKVIKAKKRILDIIIGLFIYTAMWSILQWLLPGGILNTGEICKPATTTNTATDATATPSESEDSSADESEDNSTE